MKKPATRLCAWCGLRPAAKARQQPGDYRVHYTKYCDVCRPIAYKTLCKRRVRRKRENERENSDVIWIDELDTGERVRARRASLARVGLDYVKRRLAQKAGAGTQSIARADFNCAASLTAKLVPMLDS